MPYLTAPSGVCWHYEIEGEGQPMVFLHGWSVDRRIWRQQVKYFSDRYQVIALDLPGHGNSTWETITLGEMADDVREIIQTITKNPVIMVVSSFGGLVALKLYALSPELVTCFVFAGSQPKFSRSEDYPYGLEISRIRKLSGQLERDYPAIVNIFFRSLFTRQERESRRFKWIQTFRKFESVPSQEALTAVLDILEQEDLRPVLANVACPILFANGTEDYICVKSFYEQLQPNMPHARFAWFEQCGHFPFLSRPHMFNQMVEKFLESV